MTPDLRTFIVAVGVALLAWIVGMSAVSFIAYARGDPFSEPQGASLVATSVLGGGALLALAHQYLARNVHRGYLLIGLLVAAGVVQVFLRPAPADLLDEPAAGEVPETLRGSFVVDVPRVVRGPDWSVHVRLDGMSPRHEYLLVSPSVRLEMEDGTATALPGPTSSSLNVPHLELNEGLRWLGRGELRSLNISVAQGLTPRQRDAFLRGDARLTLSGHVLVREARAVRSMPLEPGTSATSAGRRVTVAHVDRTAQPPVVRLRTSAVGPRGAGDRGGSLRRDPRFAFRLAPDYALVNESRGEAVTLRTAGSSGSMVGRVLPGIDSWGTETELQPIATPFGPEQVQLDASWLQGARLVLVDRVPIGSYPVSLQLRSAEVEAGRES